MTASEHRTYSVQMRVSKGEYEDINYAAKMANCTVSDWLRVKCGLRPLGRRYPRYMRGGYFDSDEQ